MELFLIYQKFYGIAYSDTHFSVLPTTLIP